MHRLVGAKALRILALTLLALAFVTLHSGAHKLTANGEPDPDLSLYYFPIMFRDTTIAPDLVVESVKVNSDSAVVVIKNQGTAEVEVGNSFWVDLYIDPDPMPTKPNELWDTLGAQGVVWGVWSKAFPLLAGETLTLTWCPEQAEPDPYLRTDLSKFKTLLGPGTRIAVQVDSGSVTNDYGEVWEGHEILGWAYNNISMTLSIAGTGCEALGATSTAGLLPLAKPDWPYRPRHAE